MEDSETEDGSEEETSEEEETCEAEETSEEEEGSAEDGEVLWEVELVCPPQEARDRSIAPKMGTSFCFFINLLSYLATTKVW